MVLVVALRPFVLLCVVVSIVVSGCAEDGKGAAAPSTSSAPLDSAVEPGGIKGTVTDAELTPLAGATIQLLSGIDESTTTHQADDAGAFLIEGLPPGRYIVYASAAGFREASPKTVEVVSGETLEVTFLLDKLRVQTAFVETLAYTFYYNLGWCFPEAFGEINGGIYCQGLGWDVANTTFEFDVDEAADGPIMTIVQETEWTTAAPVCQGGMRSDLYSPDQENLPEFGNMADPARSPENPYHWTNPTVTSPTKIYVPREGDGPDAMWGAERTKLNDGKPITTSGRWAVVNWADYAEGPGGTPAPVGCMVEQRLNGYVSLFHVDPAPGPEWSFLTQE